MVKIFLKKKNFFSINIIQVKDKCGWGIYLIIPLLRIFISNKFTPIDFLKKRAMYSNKEYVCADASMRQFTYINDIRVWLYTKRHKDLIVSKYLSLEKIPGFATFITHSDDDEVTVYKVKNGELYIRTVEMEQRYFGIIKKKRGKMFFITYEKDFDMDADSADGYLIPISKLNDFIRVHH